MDDYDDPIAYDDGVSEPDDEGDRLDYGSLLLSLDGADDRLGADE
jgi:hypothetical protein